VSLLAREKLQNQQITCLLFDFQKMDQANYADALVFLALHSDFTVFAVSAFFLWRKGETFSGMIFASFIII